MKTVLRICAHPGVDFLQWCIVRESPCLAADIGWDILCKHALRNYLGLGFIDRFSARRAQARPDDDPLDFRLTRTYQKMVLHSTRSSGQSRIVGYRYKEFYGIMDGQFWAYPTPRDRRRWCRTGGKFNYSLVLGRVPYDEFLAVEVKPSYMPTAEEVEETRSALATKGDFPMSS
ncbi:hypothetical protein PG988_004595 [Apiospora saccharicola]